ncbi:MAG TPA: NEW3 domain-containing protein, partial [Spirillospora sp.]|nr:NEW3 domain-containing protein [Spirillospora sp.]
MMDSILRRISLLVMLVLIVTGSSVLAQDELPTGPLQELLLFTNYPSQVVGIGETITLNLNLLTDTEPQIVDLEVLNLPENWAASFRGGGRIVESVFVQPEEKATVDLRVEPVGGIEPGTYRFSVVARGDGTVSELPVTLTVEEQAPASLAVEVDLPNVRGRPSSTFRYNLTLRNEGDVDMTVDLQASAPPFFDVVFKSGAQEVTNIPIKANGSERINVEAKSLLSMVPADTYPITVVAQGGETEATIELMAEVVGESSLTLTTPDGRLSGDAEVGKDTPVTLVLQNTGSAPARSIKMNATKPSGWVVEFEPAEVEVIEPGQQAEVTAQVRPADNALAGDYNVTFRAQPEGGSSQSVQYRATVR